ncbi:MAG: VWA domain-containing protein [Oscillospiraceae bacterium]|jgi:Ca-activated chloride channel family protein|nr:VWA domain-containing protein [Oscillospiraceae bacterium]
MNKSGKTILALLGIAIVVFGAIYGITKLTQNAGSTTGDKDAAKALSQLEKLTRSISVNTLSLVKGQLDSLTAEDDGSSLPDIEKQAPVAVEATTPDYIEIWSSPEKAGTGTDAWLTELVRQFNRAGKTVDGRKVSVKLRKMNSGDGVNYIVAQKAVPDAYSPSNSLWGEMLKAKNIKIETITERLAGNTAGILLSKSAQKKINDEYGAINLKSITQAVSENKIQMGYTNPFASSAGLNFLVSTLYTFDSKNPLADEAAAAFEQFSANIPFVSYTTMQMRTAAQSGALDGFILEYQSYMNLPDIKSAYSFTPYGVRHDEPLYAIGSLSQFKKDILRLFADYCLTPEAQQSAKEYGFNADAIEKYSYEMPAADGNTIIAAQKLWKEKKSGGADVTAVFVADVSGSMAGERLNKLKESLRKGSNYISAENSIGLITFSDEVNTAVPIGKFDLSQRAYFAGAIDAMQPAGSTAMYDAIAVAAEQLMSAKEVNPTTRLMMFVLTDGETNRGLMLNDIRDILSQLKIPIYTIGYDADIAALETVAAINEAAALNANTDDVVYQLENFFNAQM